MDQDDVKAALRWETNAGGKLLRRRERVRDVSGRYRPQWTYAPDPFACPDYVAPSWQRRKVKADRTITLSWRRYTHPCLPVGFAPWVEVNARPIERGEALLVRLKSGEVLWAAGVSG